MGGRPQYNVWIRLNRLQFSSSLALLSLVAVALSVFSPWFLLFVIPFCVFLRRRWRPCSITMRGAFRPRRVLEPR